ncbi:MAG: fibronectin type III domain-containing protein, partial [Phycisphaerae bacterium]|nr:fibronectin type III domain-containing protein [Gemmatimonadaceae bacterium]
MSSISAPSELSAEALGLSTLRVSWRPASGDDISGYELQRRADLTGEFVTLEAALPADAGSRLSYFDTKVDPNRYYGYRVRAISRLGGRSAMSNIAGAKTASVPGLRIQTTTEFATAESVDPDGYTAIIRGPTDTTTIAVGVNADRLVSPIQKGTYSIVLRGLANNCAFTSSADSIKTVTVTDEGTRTVTSLGFAVSCRDPRKASIVVALTTSGDSLDADGIIVTTSGLIKDAGVPADERVYFQFETLNGANGVVRFDNLRPAEYEISIADIDPPCVLEGERRKTIQLKALGIDTVTFALTCRKPVAPVDTAGKPFVLRHTWSATSARPGDKVSLLTALDLRAEAAQQASGVSATIQFDNAVVRYDSARSLRAFDL